MKKIVVILGPTSTGKTALSIEVAKRFNGEIISADSRQVYKELNLISGKVTDEEKQGIKHHLLDCVSVEKDFSVAEYKEKAKYALEQIFSNDKLPIIVGGTGFYIDSLVYDFDFPEIKKDEKLRDELNQKSTDELFEILKNLDSDRAENIDSKNKVRLIRAIEIAKSLGKNPPPPNYANPKYNTLFIGLDLDDQILDKKIEERIVTRINQGMITEAKNILDSRIDKNRLLNLGLDAKYSTLLALREIEKTEMIERLKLETMQYAKRQRTWWKRNKDINWYDPQKDQENILNSIEQFLR